LKNQQRIGAIKRNPTTQTESFLADSIDLTLDTCKQLHRFITLVATSLETVDKERINLKSEVKVLNEEICHLKKRLDKLENK
jgi:septal ring factor EnvC (AmiA/AmiB activator)